MLLDNKSTILLNVERAAHDLCKGFGVILTDGKNEILTFSPETISQELLKKLLEKNNAKIIFTKNRGQFLTHDKSLNNNVFCDVSLGDISDIAKLSGVENSIDSFEKINFKATNNLQNSCITLAKIAEILPCAIAIEDFDESDEFVRINASDVESYKEIASYDIVESCRTKIMLKGDIESEIIAFRPKIGGIEHYAIVIKGISKNPLVRVHSSCYTGDLLDSLACDCHDQLHLGIDVMAQNGGGIVLYMLQEGRGIGLVNKLRAYALKEQGLDTVDANEALGFDDDERLFLPAAQILKNLNIDNIRLLTNNPRKAKELEDCGIKVNECVAHVMKHNEHNEKYLKTKVDRMGHKMD